MSVQLCCVMHAYVQLPVLYKSLCDMVSFSPVIKCVKGYQGVALNGHPGFCYGNTCYAERNRVGHPRVWGCVDETVNCSVDSEAQVIQCCPFDRCNLLLDPMFPSESK